MSLFINLDTNEFPRHIGDVELDPDANWAEVLVSDTPEPFDGGFWQWGFPQVNADGVLEVTWEQHIFTEEELLQRQLADIRFKVLSGQALTADEAALLVGS